MSLSDYPIPATTLSEQYTDSSSTSGQYLSFLLDKERYAVDILNVQEIRRFESVTFVPDAPHYIKGVINLRGVIVPVMDLRLKLNMEPANHDYFTVMIVLTIGTRVIGIVVDSVCDVIELKQEHILPPPQFSASIDQQMISGISTLDEMMVIVLDSKRLTANEDSLPVSTAKNHNTAAIELNSIA